MSRRQLPLPFIEQVASRPQEPHEAAPPDAARRPDRRAGGSARRRRGEAAPPDAADGPDRSAESDETAARHFWGRRWQEHLEASPCFAKHLPGGRALCRTGVVSRADIRPGRVQGMIVRGRPHYVDVRIRKLRAEAWNAIRIACLGQIGSEDDLREGRVSGHVRDILTDPDCGLFPAPSDVKSRCSCSDAVLPCKHVMAVLWGAGGRFDADPSLFLRLRGVSSNDLVSDLRPPAGSSWRRDVLAEDAVAAVFGIVLERGPYESRFSYRDRLPVAGPRRRTAPADDRDSGNADAEKPASAGRGKAATTRKPAHGTVANRSKPGPGVASRSKPGPGARRRASAPDRSPSARPADRRLADEQPVLQESASLQGADSWRPTGRIMTRLREQTGFTVADLAELLRVSPSTVGRWENTPGVLRLRPSQREALRVLCGEAGLKE